MTHHEAAGPDTARPELTRRGALVAGTVIGVSATLAAAGCTTYRPDTGSGDGGAPAAGPSSGSASAGPGGGSALGPVSEIPVGGGKVFKAEKVVVTQPTAGTFKAFSSVCTHQGCQVSEIANGTIDCTCHGSKFSATDGSVTEGPAKRPLAARKIGAADGQLTLGA